MRVRWWSGRTALVAVGLAVCAAGLPGSMPAVADVTVATGGADRVGGVVAGALAALRENAGRLGFDSDGRGGQGLGSRYRVSVSDVMVDPNGSTHVRMDRSYAGLAVRGGDFVVHRSASGRWLGASATLSRSLDGLVLTPVVSAAGAAALVGIGGNARVARLVGVPTLSIDARGGGVPALVWEVRSSGTQGDGTPSRLVSVVDAVTGAVRGQLEQIETLRIADPGPNGPTGPGDGAVTEPDRPAQQRSVGEPALGEGRSLYDGKVSIESALISGMYSLKDLTRGGAYTADAEDATDDCLPVAIPLCTSNAPANLFKSATNRWGDGTLTNRQTVAVDATYGSDMTWDFYKNIFKRAGINNDGLGVYSRVHYGRKYANAFWNDDCFCMTFGDGDGKELGPLVSLDITGHEITHGLTARTAKLGGSGESGGLNEANSDIFGTMIEFYAKNPASPGDYLIGHTSYLHPKDDKGKLNAIRYMDEPSQDKLSPDCWNSQVKQIDVHLSAGIGNHFFYLLSEGSGRKTINGIAYESPTCDGKKITGIGRDTAAKIWFRALTHYFTSDLDYAKARAGVVSAATDLYGQNSHEVQTVNAAWDAVNVHVGDSARDLGGGLF
jgi:zinc metalloprotease ZmpA